MYIEADHLKSFLANGSTFRASTRICQEFGEYLNTLEWQPGGAAIDWSEIPHRVIDLPGKSEEDVLMEVWRSRAARHAYLLLLYSPDEPGLLSQFTFGMRNFDELYWRAPGVRYMCGADVTPEGVIPFFPDLVEFNGGDRLTIAV
jgi:hypothetical protein